MATPATPFRPTRGFWLLVPLIAAFTWAAHEAAHFAAGRALGYGMWVSMNGAGLLEGSYASSAHTMIVAMAGPAVTYIQALVAWALLRRRPSGAAYIALFFALFMRLAAFALGIVHPNDEARTSLELGLPVWAVPGVACLVLLALTVSGARTLGVGWRTNGALYLLASALTAAIVFGDPLVGRIAEG